MATLVLADDGCNSWKSDMLAGHEHLAHWRERNARADLAAALLSAGLPEDGGRVASVAYWAYVSWRTRPFPWE